MIPANYHEYKLEALTDIWTGDANRRGNRLIPTGLLGSLRWWFEVLVRGLGGRACDPTVSKVRCPDKNVKKPSDRGHHCVVCELFGCTGWARKFRLVVVDEDGQVIQDQIEAGDTFFLRFIELRPIRDEEWCLLDATLRLIADYGAIGGKTVFKPSDEWGIADLGADELDDSSGQVVVRRSRRGLPLHRNDVILEVEGQKITNLTDIERLVSGKYHGEPLTIRVQRNNAQIAIKAWAGKRHHQDLGLIHYIHGPENWRCDKTLDDLLAYVTTDSHWREAPHAYRGNEGEHDYSWASLQNFWCVKGRYLARQNDNQSTFNRVIGRQMEKRHAQQLFRNTDIDRWLAGCQQESKKVFSFKHPEKARRTFGFVKPGLVDFEEMKTRLRRVWQNEGFNATNEFIPGEQILKELFSKGGVA